MASGLPQPQQGLQNVHLALGQALAIDLSQQRGTIGVAQLVVDAALILAHVAVDRLLEFLGKLGSHLFLRAAEDERSQSLREDFTGPVVLRLGDEMLENGAAPQHARVEEFENRPEIAQIVLDRRAAQGEAKMGREQPAGLCDLRTGVFDSLGLVQNDVVERDVLEDGDIAAQSAVSREDDVMFGKQRAHCRAVEAAVLDRLQARGEAAAFVMPVE